MEDSLSRRDFLKAAAAVAGGLALPKGWIPVEAVGSGPDAKIIDGIPVWGSERPVLDPADVGKITAMYERETFRGRMIKKGATKAEISAIRKEVLPPTARYFDAVVARSAYEAKKNEGGFARWDVDQVAAFSEIVNRGLYSGRVEFSVRRVIVVDDKLFGGAKDFMDVVGRLGDSKSYPGWLADRWFGRYPFDVDFRSYFNPEYFNVERWVSDYILADGRKILFESGLAHEKGHQLFGLPDLYWQKARFKTGPEYLNYVNAYPKDMMSYNANINNFSPATGNEMTTAVRTFGYRGPITDVLPEGFTNWDYEGHDVPNSTVRVVLSGKRRGVLQKELMGTAFRSDDFWEMHRLKDVKIDEFPLKDINFEGDTVSFDREVFDRANTLIFSPFAIVNIFFPDEKDEGRHENIFRLLLPKTLFRMSYWGHKERKKEAKFNVTFLTDQAYPLGGAGEYVLEAVWKKDSIDYARNHPRVFAYCDVPGADAVHFWRWKDEGDK